MATASNSFLPFHRASIGEEEMQAVLDVLRTGWLTTGPKTKEFETAFAKYVGAKHAVAVNSCTAALHLALAAIGIQRGDEVILPTLTFAATGEVVRYFDAKPVLVDSEPDSPQVSVEAIERAITPRTRAIIVVHYAGACADLDAILKLAKQNGLRVIEDAAHALPAEYKGKRIGSFSDVTCFSFYATKTLTTGEGGMATTEDAEIADRMRILSLHGISRDAYKRYTAEGTWRYDILDAGYKYNLSDLQSALGLAQLTKCDAMRDRREQIALWYTEELSKLNLFDCPTAPVSSQHAWHLYVPLLKNDALEIPRDQFIEELKQLGIGTSVHFIPLHLHSYYQQYLGFRAGQFPNAERHFERAISLPIFPAMTDEDVERVIQAIGDIRAQFSLKSRAAYVASA